MDIRALTQSYAVSPQVAPEDFATIRAAGFVTVINNRPDAEIPPQGRWTVSGLALPSDVLTKVYRDNARTVLGLG